jgi:D-glycero-D-manno-heptose 1,7-bisphosphate phosphatase
MGFLAVVVSNQPGVVKGHFSLKSLAQMTDKMQRRLSAAGARLDGIYYCLHHPTEGRGPLRRRCGCRKPKPGLLKQAARDLGIDLKKSYMIGDSLTDIEAGRRAGCLTVLISRPKCEICRLMDEKKLKPDALKGDLAAAVKWIRSRDR